MVLVKNQTTSTINSLPNYGGEILYNTTTNKPVVNVSNGFNYFVLSTLSGVVSGLSSISATELTGTLQTAAQPNVTSVGTLAGLTASGNVNLSSHNGSTTGLQLNGTLVTSTAAELNYVDVTPGTAAANKALVLDGDGAIVGITNLETDNLTVNGTLVTASAIELNYTDVSTIGIAQASKALVLDANKDIIGIHNLETDNLTVNGTLVTASAIELNYTDVNTLGVAQASKALVFDENKDITGINSLSATYLTGTLQTAAQPNITSVGTLTSVNVSGDASVGTLTVGGVSLSPYGTNGLRTRVFSTMDFNGATIYSEISTTINFSNFAPAGQANGYSMEVWGYIKPLYTEDYTFTISSNDNFRLWINNNLVRADWTSGDHDTVQTDPISLIANTWYPIYIQHVQVSSTEKLSLMWESTSQVSQIIPSSRFSYDDKGTSVALRNNYFQDSLNFYDSTNSRISTINVNTSGDLALNSFTDNVNVVGHDGSKGLQLGGTLVTSTATELNYVDVTPGTASATKALVVDANKDIGNIRNVRTIGNLGINTSAADRQVEINSATGACLRLTYNDDTGSATNYSDFSTSSGGNLTILSAGLTTFIDVTNNLDVAGHDGSTLGLKLAGVLVTATADELNYVDTTAGTIVASKAMVVDSSRNITNLNNLRTTGNIGINTSAPDKQLEVNSSTGDCLRLTYNDTNGSALNHADFSVSSGGNLTLLSTGLTTFIDVTNNFDVVGHDGSTLGLKLAGVLVTSTAAELNYVDVTPGAGTASKALVLDANKAITGITTLGADTINVETLNITGSSGVDTLTTTGNVGIKTSALDYALEINDAAGDVLRLSYNDANGGPSSNRVDFQVSSTGTLTITPVGTTPSVNIAGHNGSTQGLQLGGTLVTSTATELNYVDVTPGTVTASKAIVVDSSKNFTGLNDLTMEGVALLTNTTDSTSSSAGGALTVAGGAAVAKKLYVGDDLSVGGDLTVTGPILKLPSGNTASRPSSAVQGYIRYNSETSQFEGFGAGDTWGSLGGVSDVDQNTKILAEDGAGTNDNNLRFFNDGAETMRITSVGLVGIGTNAPDAKLEINSSTGNCLRLTYNDANGSAANFSALTTTSGGNLKLYSSGLTTIVEETNNLDIAGHDAATLGLKLAGVLVTATAAELNLLDGVTSTTTELNYVDTTVGAVVASKAMVVDSSRNITNLNNLRTTGNLGINSSAPDKQVEINSDTGNCLRLTYNTSGGSATNYADLLTSSGGNLTILSSGLTTFIDVTNNLDVAGHDGSTLGLKLGGTLVTATAAELNLLDGVTSTTTELNYVDTTAGTVVASKAMVVDSSRNIVNLNNLRTTGNLGLNTSAPDKQLEVNSATGACLRLTYNSSSGSATNYADFSTSSGGNLTLLSSGLTTFIDVTNNLDIAGHDGNTLGLKLGGTLVTATAAELNLLDGVTSTTTELNYVDTTAGTVVASKAMVVDSSRDIANLNNLKTTGSIGVNSSAPSKQVEVNSSTGDALRLTYNNSTGTAINYSDFSVSSGGNLTILSSGLTTLIDNTNNLDVAGHDGSTLGLKLAGVLVTSTAAELNYVDVTPGAGTASKALVLDENKAITGITTLGADTINVETLNITGSSGVDTLTTTGNVGIKTSALDYALEINDAAGDVLRLSYNDANGGPSANRVDFQVSSTGTLSITPVGTNPSVNIAGHNGSSQGLQLAGTLVTSTATELNYVDVTPGTATASKALVLDANLDIATINSLTATSITGTLQTAAQTNITTVGTLAGLVATDVVNVSSHDGSTTGLQLGGTLVTSTAAELNYVDVTAGTAAASKALVLDSSKNIAGIDTMSMNTLNLTFDNATGNTVGFVGHVTRTTSVTPATGLGVGVDFFVENSNNVNVAYGDISVSANTITAGAEDGKFSVNLMTAGALASAMTLTTTSLSCTELIEISDVRMKENIIPVDLEESYNKIMDLDLVDYNFIADDTKRVHRGLIAQELRKVIPDAVIISEDHGYDDFHHVATKELTGYLMGALQHLGKKFEKLEAKYDDLKNKYDALQ
jgi:hypothetical protein